MQSYQSSRGFRNWFMSGTICGRQGVSVAYHYCKECTIVEKDQDECPKLSALEKQRLICLWAKEVWIQEKITRINCGYQTDVHSITVLRFYDFVRLSIVISFQIMFSDSTHEWHLYDEICVGLIAMQPLTKEMVLQLQNKCYNWLPWPWKHG